MKLSLSALEIFLKKQCDALRTSMDAAEYKDYIIAMIFIKWANDNFVLQQKKYAEKLRKEDSESARKLILDIGYQRLYSTIQEYLDAHIRKLQGKIEEIYDKYTVTLGSMIDERDKAVNELDSFLKQMNYL